MKSMIQKLSSKSGASMLLALVFLLFCLMVGGSVLSAATANGSRAARKKTDQQDYLSQRSASLLLADMLKSTDDSAMQLTIKDVTTEGKNSDDTETVKTRNITFMIHGNSGDSELQMLLYELGMAKYLGTLDSSAEYSSNYINFEDGYSFSSVDAPAPNGEISVALSAEGMTDTLSARYYTNTDGDFFIDYAVTPPVAEGEETQPPQHSYVTLSMKCYTAPGNPVTVNGVTTTTTVIRWDDPVIEKGGA